MKSLEKNSIKINVTPSTDEVFVINVILIMQLVLVRIVIHMYVGCKTTKIFNY